MNRPLTVYVAFLLCLLILCSCGQQPDLVGRYEATNPQHPDNVVVLVLQSSGNGSWNVEDEEVPVRWERRDQQVWLHHKGGGVVAGKIVGIEEIEIALPGIGNLLFKKTH